MGRLFCNSYMTSNLLANKKFTSDFIAKSLPILFFPMLRKSRPYLGTTFANSEDGGRGIAVIRKLPSGKYRLYSRKRDPRTGRWRNLGTFDTRDAAAKHERAVQYFKRH